MNKISRILCAAVALGVLPSLAIGQTELCPGECRGAAVPIPDSPTVLPGNPGGPGSVWADGSSSTGPQGVANPEVWESDPGPANDDYLGDGAFGSSPDGNYAGGAICNGSGASEGILSTPGGAPANGGTEGDCIEVYLKIPYWEPTYDSGGFAIEWTLKWYETKAKKVCPADPANCP